MWILLVLTALLLLALPLVRLRKHKAGRDDDARTGNRIEAAPHAGAEVCCGLHEVCERDLLLAAAGEEPVYYEDEELDAFKDRASDSYTEAETGQFEEVMTTMRPDEVAGWLRSLRARGVSLPDALRDEAVMLMSDK